MLLNYEYFITTVCYYMFMIYYIFFYCSSHLLQSLSQLLIFSSQMKQLGIFDHIFVLSAAELSKKWGKRAFDAVSVAVSDRRLIVRT